MLTKEIDVDGRPERVTIVAIVRCVKGNVYRDTTLVERAVFLVSLADGRTAECCLDDPECSAVQSDIEHGLCWFCAQPTTYFVAGSPASTQCANCWEVIGRLGRFIRSDRGRAFAEQALRDASGSAARTETEAA